MAAIHGEDHVEALEIRGLELAGDAGHGDAVCRADAAGPRIGGLSHVPAVDPSGIHLEALVGAAVSMRQPHVVKHRAGIEQLGVERQVTPHSGQCAPIEDAAGMVKQQWRFRGQ